MARVYTGTCNWSDHKDFYPEGLPPSQQLGYYAQHFPLVEIDSTFYRLMPTHHFRLWAERTPPGFIFNVKAFRELTYHDREKTPATETFRAFSAGLQPLRDAGKLRCVHFQYPPWFTFSQDNLEAIAAAQSYFPRDLFGVEFRHRSWLSGANATRTLAFLKTQGIVLTVVDEPQIGSGSVPIVIAVTNPRLAIVRFHGRNTQTWYGKFEKTADRFNYLYNEQELAEWVPRVRELAASAEEVHLLMNNNYGNYAVANARQLGLMLTEAGVGEVVPPAASSQPQLDL